MKKMITLLVVLVSCLAIGVCLNNEVKKVAVREQIALINDVYGDIGIESNVVAFEVESNGLFSFKYEVRYKDEYQKIKYVKNAVSVIDIINGYC